MYDWESQADMFYSQEEMDRAYSKGMGTGVAAGFVMGFLVAAAVFAVIGAYL